MDTAAIVLILIVLRYLDGKKGVVTDYARDCFLSIWLVTIYGWDNDTYMLRKAF